MRGVGPSEETVMRTNKSLILAACVPIAALAATDLRPPGDIVYTLYRQSVVDIRASMRTHVATFDADQGELYNRMNCEGARELFQNQKGVELKYWCEKGYFRK